jgi:hypothetical protein
VYNWDRFGVKTRVILGLKFMGNLMDKTAKEKVLERYPYAYEDCLWNQPHNFRIWVDWIGKPIAVNDYRHIGMQMTVKEAWEDAARIL